MSPVVVKVGGSLFDLPDFGPKLGLWLIQQTDGPMLLVPGGGPSAEVIRVLDRRHGLGEEAAHWLALRAMTVNAWFLAALVSHPKLQVVRRKEDWDSAWAGRRVPVVDAHAFALADEGQPGCLPHRWSVTSDSVAARLAVVARASQLILLKSTPRPEGQTWQGAAESGYVDSFFAEAARDMPCVQVVDFRAWAINHS